MIRTKPLRYSLLLFPIVLGWFHAPVFGEVDVVVDPGHGGCSGLHPCGTQTRIPGYDTCSLCTTYGEKWVNLEVGLELWNLIVFNPPDPGTLHFWTYDFTRTSDIAMQPAERAYYANRRDAKRLVSIHHNYSADSTTQHYVVLYSGEPMTSVDQGQTPQPRANVILLQGSSPVVWESTLDRHHLGTQ